MFSITLGLTKASIHMQTQQLYNYYDKVNTLQSTLHNSASGESRFSQSSLETELCDTSL